MHKTSKPISMLVSLLGLSPTQKWPQFCLRFRLQHSAISTYVSDCWRDSSHPIIKMQALVMVRFLERMQECHQRIHPTGTRGIRSWPGEMFVINQPQKSTHTDPLLSYFFAIVMFYAFLNTIIILSIHDFITSYMLPFLAFFTFYSFVLIFYLFLAENTSLQGK